MLYKLRTGDILLCKNKPLNRTNAYLLVHDTEHGFGLWCLGCGEAVGFYGNDTNKLKNDLTGFLNLQHIIPKEILTDFINNNYKLSLPVKAHDGFNDINIEIDFEPKM